MHHLYVYSTDPQLPRTAKADHEGFWTFTLADGTFFHVVACAHAGAMRMHFNNHAPAATVLPSARSTTPIAGAALASLTAHLGAAPASTYATLSGLFAKSGDPMLDPDSAT